MNDPVTMPDVLPNTDLIAHRKALEAAGAAIKLAMRIPAPGATHHKAPRFSSE